MFSQILKNKWVKNIAIFIFLISISIKLILILEQYCRRNDKSFLEVLHPEWFTDITKFPNEDFKCRHNCEIYNMKVTAGYTVMKQTRIVIMLPSERPHRMSDAPLITNGCD